MVLYDIAFIVSSVFYAPLSIYKKGFRSFNLKWRLGFIPRELSHKLTRSKNIWVHAVSVGEVMLLAQFLPALKKQFPGHCIVISTVTRAGNEVAKRKFGENASVIFLPLDISFIVKRFFLLIRPKIFIIVETEIWPNLITVLKRCGAPVVMINGRISPRSFRRYKIIKPFLKPILEKIDLFCMQSKDDARRIASIGAPSEKVHVTGNMKFDTGVIEDKKRPANRDLLGLTENDVLIVAGSTHRGEEEVLLGVYKDLRSDFPNLQLLIAPRHIERIPEIKVLAEKKGIVTVRISEISATYELRFTPVFLLDTIGQLRDFYSIADIVFIGGSLIPHGGQNPVEPAYFLKPIVFGPSMFNFKDIARILLQQGAAAEVKDAAGFKEALAGLIREPKRRYAMGFFAKKAIEENKGASGKNVGIIKDRIPLAD